MKGKMICALPLLMLGGVTLTANAAANATLNKTAIVDEAMPGLIWFFCNLVEEDSFL